LNCFLVLSYVNILRHYLSSTHTERKTPPAPCSLFPVSGKTPHPLKTRCVRWRAPRTFVYTTSTTHAQAPRPRLPRWRIRCPSSARSAVTCMFVCVRFGRPTPRCACRPNQRKEQAKEAHHLTLTSVRQPQTGEVGSSPCTLTTSLPVFESSHVDQINRFSSVQCNSHLCFQSVY